MTDYHKLTIAEKERYARDRVREPPVRCPVCEMAVQPEDLIAHAEERCPGRPAPHPRSKWVSSGQAVDLGVTKTQLSRLVSAGEVRTKGDPGERLYLLRDVAKFVVSRSSDAAADRERGQKRAQRRKQKRTQKRSRKWLTESPTSDHGLDMQPLDEGLLARLRAMAERCGGVAPASRLLDVSLGTLRSAMAGRAVRRGTKALIEGQLAKAEGAQCQ